MESAKLSVNPSFLYFYSAKRTRDYMYWKRTRPLSGFSMFPFQSGPDIELVVMNVRSIILRGISLLSIFDC